MITKGDATNNCRIKVELKASRYTIGTEQETVHTGIKKEKKRSKMERTERAQSKKMGEFILYLEVRLVKKNNTNEKEKTTRRMSVITYTRSE